VTRIFTERIWEVEDLLHIIFWQINWKKLGREVEPWPE